MKRIFAFVLLLVLSISLCACTIGPETFETPDGETIRVDSVEGEETVVFEHETQWTVTKTDITSYKGGTSTGTVHHNYVAVLTCEEYACYVNINGEYYTLLNDGDVVTATYSEIFLGTHLTQNVFTFKNGETFTATCYKNVKIGE